MHLKLIGHDCKYAVEQIMLTLFPTERPIYHKPVGPDFPSASIELICGEDECRAETRLYLNGREYFGASQASLPDRADKVSWNRDIQKHIKLSFFHAATAATSTIPPWGALTGIRPGKLVTRDLEAGLSANEALSRLETEYFVSPERAALCLETAQASLRIKNKLKPRDICLYIGIPFCPTRCAYCSFVSNSVEKSMHLVKPFLETLHREIEAAAQVVDELGLRIVSVYMGGGTPTTLSPDEMGDLTDKLAGEFDLSHLQEYTVEAGRPDTLTAEKLRGLKDAGVSRISINPQTMEDNVLEAIGRRHTAADIDRALALARAQGFSCINMDLIAGLPADSAGGFGRSLDKVMACGAENITVHTLALKKGSKIMENGTTVPSPSEVGNMLDTARQFLSQGMYRPYYLYRQKFISGGFENVGWSKPGQESLYNIAIMEELCSILSLGGGGSTKLVAPETGHIKRIFNPKYPYEYINGIDKVIENKQEILPFYKNEVFFHGL